MMHEYLPTNRGAALGAGNDKDIIPAMVPRLPDSTPITTRLAKARQNLLSGWTEECFKWERFEFTLVNQKYVVCNHPRHVRRVFLDNHDNYDRKSPQMRSALEPLLGDGMFVSDGDLWRQRRELCAPSMRPDLLPLFAPLMIDTSLEMAERWTHLDGSEIDVLSEMGQLTARIIGRTIFGDDTTLGEAEAVVSGFAAYQRSIEQLDLSSTLGLPLLRLVPKIFQRGYDVAAAQQVQSVIDRIIARHRAGQSTGRGTPNLIQMFLDAENVRDTHGSCPVSNTALRNEAIVMFMAGHETTANTLAWAWYIMSALPSVANALHRELDQVLAGRTPRYEDVARLPVTRAIIEETLRLYPPVPLLSRQARGPDKLGKLNVNAGDIMLVVPWILHRHDKYWDAPNKFHLERFLPGAPRPDRFTYLPFSVGHRVCLGQRFGLTETILCLAILAQKFELSLRPNHDVNVSCRLTLRPEGGLPMRIRMRSPP